MIIIKERDRHVNRGKGQHLQLAYLIFCLLMYIIRQTSVFSKGYYVHFVIGKRVSLNKDFRG